MLKEQACKIHVSLFDAQCRCPALSCVTAPHLMRKCATSTYSCSNPIPRLHTTGPTRSTPGQPRLRPHDEQACMIHIQGHMQRSPVVVPSGHVHAIFEERRTFTCPRPDVRRNGVHPTCRPLWAPALWTPAASIHYFVTPLRVGQP